MSSQCEGCNRSFLGGRFLQHLRKTTNRACQQYAAKLYSQAAVFPPESSTAANTDSDLEGHFGMQGITEFMDIDRTGDYFGNYDDLRPESDIGPDSTAAFSVSAGHDAPPPPTHPDCFRKPFVKNYPDPRAGAPLPSQTTYVDGNSRYTQDIGQKGNVWAPFQSEIDWKVAKWAKLRGPSSTAVTELLSIDGVPEKLGLSYNSVNQLNTIIDNNLPSRPRFKRHEVVVQGEVFEMYFRDIMECVKALYNEPEFAPYLKFAPEQHFENDSCEEQLFHDMHTGRWWWSTQKALDKTAGPGRTVVPIILSSDKTQVTVFRNKSAYPVYLTIGNIPKELRRKPSRRAYILLGYLPTTRLEHITSEASRRRTIANLYHTCMRHIVKPLEAPGATGTVMTSGDGVDRLTHPIFAVYIGDYPEQILVTCGITGFCPRCSIPRQRVGENTEPHPLRNLQAILEALRKVDEGASVFVRACKDVGIKPVFEPFWANLPYSNVFMSITPDLLHQLYQGVLKHLKLWIIEAYGAHEIDARCRRLPPNHNIRIFVKGISTLSHVSGQEHDQISHFLLGLIADALLPNGMSNVRLLRCLRGLLDFLFLAQYPVHSDSTLSLMSTALENFHANKQIFVDIGIRSNFRIPKIHFMNHYLESIKLFGTLDNFNTEYTERLHIDLAKDAYRSTNRKDEYSQMMKWLERKEKHPSAKSVKIPDLTHRFGAKFFRAALSRFIVQLESPGLSGRRLEDAVDRHFLGISSVAVYHRIKYLRNDLFTGEFGTADSIHVEPARTDKRGHTIPGRFDTALVRINDSKGFDNITQDMRIGQVRLVFTLSEKDADRLFCAVPVTERPKHLAYIEWFTKFGARDPNHGLYKVSRCNVEGGRLASVVDIRRLIRSVHLFPQFGRVASREWTSGAVLEACSSFFVNSDSDRHMYQLFSTSH
ncbi:hypothetical protein K435DRAFT_823723 [Dendrothele bispora CBS 962.96]|uniref:C2H2-type domain-containing protein n=1 Tax=Dendrothele bispora (strain CBS 962.96) TaxID=1314807 RepID=A0A4S8KW41_DENBC|nr:hypothetical protein K435DRAFT_823723 [Dendrothele bispora CBS 962.96]